MKIGEKLDFELCAREILLLCMLCYPVILMRFIEGEKIFRTILVFFVLLVLLLQFVYRRVNWCEAKAITKVIGVWLIAVLFLLAVHHRPGFTDYIVIPFVVLLLYFLTANSQCPARVLYVSSAVFCILMAGLQYYDVFYLHHVRGGLEDNPVPFAQGCTFMIGGVLIGVMDLIERKDKLIFIALCMLAALAGLYLLYLSQTRGAQIAVGVLLVFMLARCIYRKEYFLGAVIGLVIVIAAIYTYQRFLVGFNELSAFADSSNRDTSWGIRLQLWGISWVGLQDHPLVGWGPNCLAKILESHPEILKTYHWITDAHFHSDFFNLAATGGTVLLAGYFWLVGGLAWLARKNVGALWAVVNLLVLGFSDCPFWSNQVVATFYMTYLLFMRCVPLQSDKPIVG